MTHETVIQGTIKYLEPAKYQIYEDVENKKNHMNKNLILAINNLQSIE